MPSQHDKQLAMDGNGLPPHQFSDEENEDEKNISNGRGGDPSKVVVKAKNMNTIYVKTADNAASLHVAVPTTAMKEGGTETRLTFTVLTLLFSFLSPAVLLIRALFVGMFVEENYLRGAAAFLALFFLFTPLYGMWRYRYGMLAAVFMTCRMVFTPILTAYSIFPDKESFPIALGFSIALTILLELFRYGCRAEPVGKDGKMRILIIGDAVPPKVDGVATFAENSLQILHAKGHELHLVTSIAGPKHLYGCEITRLPGMTTPISPGHSITLPLPSVLWIMYKFKPHCMHLFEVSPLNLATFAYCHIADIPVTFSHHTRLDLYINIVTPQLPLWLNALILYTLERIFYPLVDGHLAVSKVLFDKVKNRGTRNVRFWDSGVSSDFDRSKFSAETRAMLSGGDVDLPLVCHIGRLGPEKNSDEIPDIMMEVNKLMKGQVRFAIVGDGVLRPQVEDTLKNKYGIKHCVFPGFLRGLALQQAYASCDIFFSPSTTEGFPLVFLEAMASGLAVVGPIAGGVPDGFDEGEQGCLYDPHDAKAAARAIKKAIDGGSEMREKAYKRGKQFSWPHSVEELEDILKFIVRAKERSGWRMWWRDVNVDGDEDAGSRATKKQS